MERKSIGIIGAGASGLTCAKHMMDEGYAVTLYEIGSHVGGMWVYQNDNAGFRPIAAPHKHRAHRRISTPCDPALRHPRTGPAKFKIR